MLLQAPLCLMPAGSALFAQVSNLGELVIHPDDFLAHVGRELVDAHELSSQRYMQSDCLLVQTENEDGASGGDGHMLPAVTHVRNWVRVDRTADLQTP
jgi:hypothetical protein